MIFLKKKYAKPNLSVIILLLLLILIVSLYVSEKNMNNYYSFSPIGEWRGNANDITMIMTYSENNKCKIDFISDLDFKSWEQEISGICEINFLKSPALLSIRTIQELSYPLFTIVQIIDNKTIKIGSFSDKWRLRPLIFKDRNSILLNKI